MTIDQIRASIKSSVWRGIAQSGVDLSSLPADAQNRLVDNISNSVMVAVNEVMQEATRPAAAEKSAPRKPAAGAVKEEEEEVVVWEGRPFLSLVEFYTITSERVKIVTGLFGKDIENVELVRIQDIDVTQNMGERIFNIGDIQIRGADASNPMVTLRNISDPQEVYELLRRTWLAARKRYGLQFREEM